MQASKNNKAQQSDDINDYCVIAIRVAGLKALLLKEFQIFSIALFQQVILWYKTQGSRIHAVTLTCRTGPVIK
jgi:hypothetical protein